ncbi:MAG: DegT/DnrJ/EryC1/StrS family aminotransferase [Anaerolineales bacterium]|nr:DegT/DnrJ/EryC1/StrS family aminotransferase [Anaerolineales bacterium]
MDWRVPLADLNFGPEEEEAVLQVVRSGWLSMGGVTRQFEQAFAETVGAKHALAVTNGTAALHLACLAAGLGPGDEVILPSLTFVATANAVRYTGATPVFADVESTGWLTISPASIKECITEKTRAIMLMHYAGYACDMPAIMQLARSHSLIVLEDAAHAAGALLDGRRLGTWGRLGCYSFFSNKNMTTGEGGMLVTNEDALYEHLRIIRSHGMTTLTWDRHQGHAWSYDVVDLGYNYRIDEMRSALGLVQLGRLPEANRRRKQLTELYRELLGQRAPELQIPFRVSRGESGYHIFPVLLPPGRDRIAFMDGLKAYGIQTSIHYPPVHQFRIYAANRQEAGVPLTITEEVASREVTLPLYPGMSDEQAAWVVEAIEKVLHDEKTR